MTVHELHWPNGSLSSGRWMVDLDQKRAGWAWTSLRVLTLGPGESERFETGEQEILVLPLAGSCSVSCDGQQVDLTGRVSVFHGNTDFAYVPRHSAAEISSEAGGRFALPGAIADGDFPFRHAPVTGTSVELRGAGACSRQVNNFCTETAFPASRLLACEVITPAGNWSSYPPHKHDEDRHGESVLEEIYYFEIADGTGQDHTGLPGPDGTTDGDDVKSWAGPGTDFAPGPGVGYQRAYGSAGRPLDLLAEVRSGDVVLIPHGWHGPSMAAPGYDMYYLNVMAGPGERRWLICDDPAHAWVRDTWAGQDVDPRLPFYGSGARSGQ
jgi:5-deoxy-glucuronate isomerase